MTLDPELFPPMRVAPGSGAQLPVPAAPAETPEPEKSAITDYDSRLIADLVGNIRYQADVLKQYGLTPEDLAAKMLNPGFAAHYRETSRIWNSDLKTADRIRAKAAFLLEDSLPELSRIAKGGQMPIAAKLSAIEQLTKISTVSHVAKAVDGDRELHKIVINIGTDKPTTIISQEPSNDRRD